MAKKKGTSGSADTVRPVDRLVDKLVAEFIAKIGDGTAYGTKVADFPSGRAVLDLEREDQVTAVERVVALFTQWDREVAAIDATLQEGQTRGDHPGWRKYWARGSVLRAILDTLLRRKLPFSEAQLTRLLKWPLKTKGHVRPYMHCLSGASLAATNFARGSELSPPLRKVLESFLKRLPRENLDKTDRKIIDRLSALIQGGGAQPRPSQPAHVPKQDRPIGAG